MSSDLQRRLERLERAAGLAYDPARDFADAIALALRPRDPNCKAARNWLREQHGWIWSDQDWDTAAALC